MNMSVQFTSVTLLFLTLCDPVDCSMPGFPVHQQLPELTQTRVHWVGNAIQPSHPLSPSSPFYFQSFPASESFPLNQLITSGSQSIGTSISVLSNEYSGLISFRIDWLDLLAVQGTLKSCLQHHSSKASILWCSAFFIFLLKSFAQEFWRRLPLSSLPPQ